MPEAGDLFGGGGGGGEPMITSEHVVGELDPDDLGWSARDRTPGPAGTAGLTFLGEVELEVDVASPATFVGLWVPAPVGDRARGAVARLLGDQRAAALLGLASPGAVVLPGPDRATRRFGRPSPRRGTVDPGGVDASIARVALAGAAVVAAAPDPLVRALGHLDAVAGLAGVRRGIGTRARRQGAALAGAELLLGVARRGELAGRPVDGGALARVLGLVVPMLDGPLAAEVRALVGAIVAGAVAFAPVPVPEADPGLAAPGAAGAGRAREAISYDATAEGSGGAVERAAAPAASMAVPAAAPVEAKKVARPRPVGRLLAVDLAALPHALADLGVAARTTTASEVEVRVPGRADDATRWWARAFAPDGVVLAAAPFRPAGGDAVARLLVPPEALLDVLVDVTGQPGEPRPSSAALGVLDAVALGQAAARAERLGAATDAAARWHRCADRWDQAGAPQRAGLARRFAGETHRGTTDRIPPPLLADPLLETLSP